MLDLKNSNYFNKLPKMTQESIMQSGINFKTEAELRNFVLNLEKE